jgi:hypothetical protein
VNLTDEELYAIHNVLYDEYYYGRELMYQATEEAEGVASVLTKIDAEFKKRKL